MTAGTHRHAAICGEIVGRLRDTATLASALPAGRFAPGRTHGVAASFFALEDASTAFATGSAATGNPIVTRPFFNALTNLQDAAVVAFLGAAAGSIAAVETSRLLGAATAICIHRIA